MEQQPDSGHTEMTLAVTATDADSGVKGYAVTTEEKAPALDSFTADVPKADHNGVYYIWAADKAGNISAAAKVNVTALDIVCLLYTSKKKYCKMGRTLKKYTHLSMRGVPICCS